jgi:hypothetical protein
MRSTSSSEAPFQHVAPCYQSWLPLELHHTTRLPVPDDDEVMSAVRVWILRRTKGFPRFASADMQDLYPCRQLLQPSPGLLPGRSHRRQAVLFGDHECPMQRRLLRRI